MLTTRSKMVDLLSAPLQDSDTYTKEEIDAIIFNFTKSIKEMLDDVIVLSDGSTIPNPNNTSLWAEVVREDVNGEFTGWYNRNNQN